MFGTKVSIYLQNITKIKILYKWGSQINCDSAKITQTFIFPTKTRAAKIFQRLTRLAWQQDPSTLISIGVVGGVVIENDLALGCLLMGSFSKNRNYEFVQSILLASCYFNYCIVSYRMSLHLPSSSITFISISSKDSILDGLKRADLPNWKKKWHMINDNTYWP